MDNFSTNRFTNWANEPTVDVLKQDYTSSENFHNKQVGLIDLYMDNLYAEPIKFKKKNSTRSTIQPKLIRKQAEWRYASLSEPFLDTENIFRVEPVTWEDQYSAKQNELVLNYQFNTQINKIKLIDDYVRDCVNTGTAILRVGWEEYMDVQDIPVPSYGMKPINAEEEPEAFQRFQRIASKMQDTIYVNNVPAQWKQCVTQAQRESQEREQQVVSQIQQQMMSQAQAMPPEQQKQLQEQMQQMIQQQLESLPPIAYEPIEQGTQYTRQEKKVNRPTVQLCHYRDVYADPTCDGDISRAEYIIYKFDSCKADLLANPIYQNVEQIPDSSVSYEIDDRRYGMENHKDPARRKITVYEYWGNWDINGDGTKVPIVASWVGDTLIRLEENPYPDHRPPFIFVPYLPVPNSIYGEPDGALLVDNQKIIGAITRGIIDLLARSANSQIGTAQSFLDPVNKKRFEDGMDYEFNPTMPPQQAVFEHTFPEIPQTVMPFLQSLEYEAEALTGVKGFSDGLNGDQVGNTAAGVRSVLDASSKREMAILRRLADGFKQVARKIIAMNNLWLDEVTVIRITAQDFVEIRRDDLAGNFDISLSISSAEQDNAKAESLAFMLQTMGNTVDQGMTQMILSEICRLRKMPELAERVARFTPPEPDPMQQRLQMAQVELIEAQVAKYKAEAMKAQSGAELDGAKAQNELAEAQIKPYELQATIQEAMAKAQYNNSLSKKMNLDYMNELTGVSHKRDLEKQAAQAKAQADKSAKEAYWKYQLAQQQNSKL